MLFLLLPLLFLTSSIWSMNQESKQNYIRILNQKSAEIEAIAIDKDFKVYSANNMFQDTIQPSEYNEEELKEYFKIFEDFINLIRIINNLNEIALDFKHVSKWFKDSANQYPIPGYLLF